MQDLLAVPIICEFAPKGDVILKAVSYNIQLGEDLKRWLRWHSPTVSRGVPREDIMDEDEDDMVGWEGETIDDPPMLSSVVVCFLTADARWVRVRVGSFAGRCRLCHRSPRGHHHLVEKRRAILQSRWLRRCSMHAFAASKKAHKSADGLLCTLYLCIQYLTVP